MNRFRFFVIACVSIVFVLSCSSTDTSSTAPAYAPQPAAAAPPQPAAMPAAETTEPSGDMATVTIYREKSFVGFALRPTVMVDGKDLVNMGNGKVYRGRFAPGKYLFQMDDKKSGAELELKPGEEVYFRVEIVPGMWKGGGRMTLMDPRQGSTEAKSLTPVDPGEIEDKSHPSS